jgi:hypothetical protein
MDGQYVKETIFKDLSQKSGDESESTQDFVGFKEGKNEHGQVWKEDWQKNVKGNYYRWNKYTEENKDGYVVKYGQWQESKKGEFVTGEKWCEVYNQEHDYWERKA